MQKHHIGNLALGIDGHDAYYRIDLDEDDLVAARNAAQTPSELVLAQLPPAGASASPGQLFCDGAVLIPFPHTEDRLIAVVRMRRDI